MTTEPQGGAPDPQGGVTEPQAGVAGLQAGVAATQAGVAATQGGVAAPQGGAPRRHQDNGSGKPHRARLRFERLPAAYCHPERIARLLPGGLPAGFRDRLIGSARLRLRLSALLARRFRLAPCCVGDLETPEGRFAQLEGEALKSALLRAGAIWHARKIRKIILAEPLRQLIDRLGRDNHRAALRFIDLAAEDGTAEDATIESGADDDAKTSTSIEKLLGWIERDGLIAVNAWCHHQPAALAGRLRLKLPPCAEVDEQPPASYQDRGLTIVDRVVMTLNAETRGIADGHG